jgi:hypothetical protein
MPDESIHLRRDTLPHPVPPHVDQGGDARELLADFVQGVLLDRQAMRFDQCFKRRDLPGPGGASYRNLTEILPIFYNFAPWTLYTYSE